MMLKITYYTAVTGRKTRKRWSVIVNISEVLTFFKEGYVQKIMINLISEESKFCYIRSKCSPSMKQGMYNQWILVSRDSPCTITKAYCSCPAGYSIVYFNFLRIFPLKINTNVILYLSML